MSLFGDTLQAARCRLGRYPARLSLDSTLSYINDAMLGPDFGLRAGREMGFAYVAAGPLVRSSYKAAEFFAARLVRARLAERGEGAPAPPPTPHRDGQA